MSAALAPAEGASALVKGVPTRDHQLGVADGATTGHYPWVRIRPTPPRQPSEWKTLLPLSIFVMLWGCVTIALELTVLSLIFLLCAVPLAFVAGYFYRAHVTATERKPWPRFLTVEGDDERNPGGGGGQVT